MAAPAEKSIKDLSGKWSLNKTLSGNSDAVLAIQGINYLMRTAISFASVNLIIKQYEGPPNPGNDSTDTDVTHIDIIQTAFKVSSNSEPRCLDDTWRPHNDKLFGELDSRTLWVTLEDEEVLKSDEFLREGWLVAGEPAQFVMTEAKSKNNGWTVKQIWGFREINGERRYARNLVTTKGDEVVKITLYYNYDGPL